MRQAVHSSKPRASQPPRRTLEMWELSPRRVSKPQRMATPPPTPSAVRPAAPNASTSRHARPILRSAVFLSTRYVFTPPRRMSLVATLCSSHLDTQYNTCCPVELSESRGLVNAKGEVVITKSARGVGIELPRNVDAPKNTETPKNDAPKTVGPAKNLDPTLKPARTLPRQYIEPEFWNCCMPGCNECILDIDCTKGTGMCRAYAPPEVCTMLHAASSLIRLLIFAAV
jgi:hypothetical protein